MTQYLLSVHHEGDYPEPDTAHMQRMFAQVDAFNASLQESGAWVFAGGLHPKETATTIRYKEGSTLVTDGPFAETKEQLGGFWVLKADDLDSALAWAKKATVACEGPVEVRPFQDDAED